jgi:rod shape determining protein RodA
MPKKFYSLMFQKINQLRGADWIFVLAIFTLVVLGLAAIYSVELSRDSANLLLVKKQTLACLVGVVVFFTLALSNFKLFQNYSFALYTLCILALIAVLLVGSTIRGSTGWFDFGGVNLQPVEFMKVSLVISLAAYFARHQVRPFSIRYVIESGLITLFPVVLVLMQPDFGSASVLIGTWFIILICAGLPWRMLLGAIVVFAAIFAVGWQFFFADYQQARILSFIDPSRDPLGQGYNVTQAIIAIGSGGLFGSGLGFGTQSQLKFLPESQTDFIFAVIGEELGFVGVCIVLLSFGVIFFRIRRHVVLSRDDFANLLLLGSGAVIFLQFFVNVAMNLGLFPVTGIGLPFVSYGGSSLLAMFALAGIAESIFIRREFFRCSDSMVF